MDFAGRRLSGHRRWLKAASRQPGWLGGGDQTSVRKVLMKTGGPRELPTDSKNIGVSYKPPGTDSANKQGWEARCSPEREQPAGRP